MPENTQGQNYGSEKKQWASSDKEHKKSSNRRQWSARLDALAMRNLYQLFHV